MTEKTLFFLALEAWAQKKPTPITLTWLAWFQHRKPQMMEEGA